MPTNPLPTLSPLSPSLRYVGCFKSQFTPYSSVAPLQSAGVLTFKQCWAYAEAGSNQYFGLGANGKCGFGNNLNLLSSLGPADACVSSGGYLQGASIGGVAAIALYSLQGRVPTPAPTMIALDSAVAYVGCLPGGDGYQQAGTGLTFQGCMSLAVSSQQQYFGLMCPLPTAHGVSSCATVGTCVFWPAGGKPAPSTQSYSPKCIPGTDGYMRGFSAGLRVGIAVYQLRDFAPPPSPVPSPRPTLASPPTLPRLDPNVVYRGCYNSPPKYWVQLGKMSLVQCYQLSQAERVKYFGSAASDQCFFGHDYSVAVTGGKSTYCKIATDGFVHGFCSTAAVKGQASCGVAVYDNSNFAELPLVLDDGSVSYTGCFFYSGDWAQVGETSFAQCLDTATAANQTYFGVLGGSTGTCVYGSNKGLISYRGTDSRCFMSSDGYMHGYWSTDWGLAVYAINRLQTLQSGGATPLVPLNVSEVAYMGCFLETGSWISMGQAASFADCMALSSAAGASYFGMQANSGGSLSSRSCLAGSLANALTYRGTSADCVALGDGYMYGQQGHGLHGDDASVAMFALVNCTSPTVLVNNSALDYAGCVLYRGGGSSGNRNTARQLRAAITWVQAGEMLTVQECEQLAAAAGHLLFGIMGDVRGTCVYSADTLSHITNTTSSPHCYPAADGYMHGYFAGSWGLAVYFAKAFRPTAKPSSGPTTRPTVKPTIRPTTQPTTQPTAQPTTQPTTPPTVQPTAWPTHMPTFEPTHRPTPQPTVRPTYLPSVRPTP